MADLNRRTRKTVTVVSAFYVVIGFCLAIPAAVDGDRLSTFLGFLIISGALAAGVLISAVFSLGARLETLEKRMSNGRHPIQHRRRKRSWTADRPGLIPGGQAGAPLAGADVDTHQIDGHRGKHTDRPRHAVELDGASEIDMDEHDRTPRITMLDLVAIGPGDPALLTAASLPHSTFPRLVASSDRKSSTTAPAAGDNSPEAGEGATAEGLPPEPAVDRPPSHRAGSHEAAPAAG